MALDEALFRVRPVRPTLRTYWFEPPTLSLGYFQTVGAADLAPYRAKGYGVVRRPTGGRAILHDVELTYSVVWGAGEPGLPVDAVGAYEVVHGALARAYRRFGIEAAPRGDRPLASDSPDEDEFRCFYRSSEFDLVRDGRKLVGSAQRRGGGAFLMHGSVPLAENPVTPRAAWGGVEREALGDALEAELSAALGVVFEAGEPTAEEAALAADLAERKYGRDEFTIGRRARDRAAGW